VCEQLENGFAACPPPVVGILLGPAGFRRGEGGVFGGAGGKDSSVAIDEDSAGTAGAHVDAEKFGGH
jgi:hypothetical protein